MREKRITEITDLRDESDRDGIRVVIELKRDAIPPIVLNQLFKHTQMQSTFGVIMLALVDGVPKIMNLKEMIQHFVAHRHAVVVRRAEYELKQALDREHILEGLKIAVDNIDEVVELIKTSPDTDTAGQRCRSASHCRERQAKAILDMRLARLTGLEIEKLEAELAKCARSSRICATSSPASRAAIQIIKDELRISRPGSAIRAAPRSLTDTSMSLEDLLADEEMVITISHEGYIKRLPADTYRAQRRGGRGIQGMEHARGRLGRAPLCWPHARLPDGLHDARVTATGSRCTRCRRRARLRAASRS